MAGIAIVGLSALLPVRAQSADLSDARQRQMRTSQAVAAADSGRWSEVAKLVNQGIDVDVYVTVRYDDAGNARKGPLLLTAVHDQEDLPPQQRGYRQQVAELLLQHGARVEATDDIGTTPLHWAVKPEIVTQLLSRGASVNARDITGNTPLHSACAQAASAEKISQLIDNHADVDVQNNARETPLRLAVIMGNLEAVQLLVEHGANVNQPGPDGKTPLALAVKGSEIEAYLEAHGR
jgi:ankyrin repeat protein